MYVGQNGKATLLHVTVAGNTGPSISGPAISLATGALLMMSSSIVTGTCSFPQTPHFPHAQQNVLTSQTCGDDAPVPDAGLQSLSAQGNIVPTIALKPTSPAVDYAFPNTCPPVDARGVKRPQGAGCDAGAYELVKP